MIIKFRKFKEIDVSSFVCYRSLRVSCSTDLSRFRWTLKISKWLQSGSVGSISQHAPLKTKRVEYELYQPCYCSDIDDVVRNCRKLERTWKADVKNEDKWMVFDKHWKVIQVIIRKARRNNIMCYIWRKLLTPEKCLISQMLCWQYTAQMLITH